MNNLLRLYEVEEILLYISPDILDKKYWGKQYKPASISAFCNIDITVRGYDIFRYKNFKKKESFYHLIQVKIPRYVNYLEHTVIIDMGRCYIKKIENLDRLINLEFINLSNNKIKKIENLDRLINLEFINLYNNKIKKIENLENSTKLKQLYLGNNRIKKIENLESLQMLKHLDISNNPFNFNKTLIYLSTLNLKSLDMQDTVKF